MGIVWGEFRTQIRRSFLNDPATDTFTNDQIMDGVNWALTEFASHTAPLVVQEYSDTTIKVVGDIYEEIVREYYDMSLDVSFPLTHEAINNIQDEGKVYIQRGYARDYLVGAQASTLRELPGSSDTFEHLNDQLVLAGPAGKGAILHIHYFSYYDKVMSDDDVINIPRWAESLVACLTAANALTSAIMQEVSISQFKESPESGNPEHNAHRNQQKFLLKRYENEIVKFPPQDRANYFGDQVWLSQYQ